MIGNDILLLVFLPCIVASRGDRDPHFISCVSKCRLKDRCAAGEADGSLWPCGTACNNICALNITRMRINNKAPPLQYHGRWAFIPLFGAQEPASVLFSLCNLLVHARELHRTGRNLGHWMLFTIANCIAWACATVFHVSDIPATEQADYISAAFVLWVGLCLTIHHVWRRHVPFIFILAVMLLGSALHVQLMFPRIDYGASMRVCVALIAISAAVWVVHLVSIHHTPRATTLLLFLCTTCVASALEALDFPPVWFVLDAHAMWHASTAITAPLFYQFLNAERCG